MTGGAADREKMMRGRIEAVTAYVHDCDARINQGEVLDLKGLDTTVAAICNDIEKLPPATAQGLEPDMATLITALDRLARTIRVRAGAEDDDGDGDGDGEENDGDDHK